MSQPPALPNNPPMLAFAYRAQDAAGQPVSGTIDAPDLEEATRRLQSLGLRIVSIDPVAAPVTPRPLRAGEFIAFNEQLAQLTTAGLPVEHGLKLIAQDLHGGRLADTVKVVAEELERGTSLADALAKNRNQFPPLYSRLVEAGVKSNSLGGLLLNLSVHLEMVRRLRATLWRIVSYPLMVLIGLMIVLLFLSRFVFPQFQEMYQGYKPHPVFPMSWVNGRYEERTIPPFPTMPLITQFLFAVGSVMPFIVIALIAVLSLLPLIWRSLINSNSTAFETFTYRVPLIGPILRMSVLARWCDIARLGVSAGLDLPAAIQLAGDAIASPSLSRDGVELIDDLSAGRPIDANEHLKILPRVVPASIEMASRTSNLGDTLGSLADVYRRQAEALLDNLPVILSPLLLIVLALSIGFVIAALMLPVLNYIHYVSGVL
jgi:type IV pilus assembly protein PilC